jgi:primosomal protein N'
VVDADLGLAHGDPRAAERTFQLLTQVTGRAGRAGQASRGLLQTYAPEHPAIQALVSGDREAFYATESETRRRGQLPPFGKLASIIVSATDRHSAQAHARAMAMSAPLEEGVRLLGPAEAPLAVLRGRHRLPAAGPIRLIGAAARLVADLARHLSARSRQRQGCHRRRPDQLSLSLRVALRRLGAANVRWEPSHERLSFG